MELRPELTPPVLDQALVAQLARFADRLDGARPGQGDDDLTEFNRLAGTALSLADFQGVHKAENPEDFVRRALYRQRITPAPGVTRAELAEVVRRAMPQNGYFDRRQVYMAIFDANVPRKGASNLIFYPPDYDPRTNTWGGGRPMGQYDPTPEQIVDWALGGG